MGEPLSLLLALLAGLPGGGAEPFQQAVPGAQAKLEMVPIPAATVRDAAGAEHTVGGYWMATTEVTWDLFDAFVLGQDGPELPPGVDAVARPSKPYITADRGFGREGYPALSIGLPAAQAFCEWLSAHTGRTWRLPSALEWQHAALAGDEGPWHGSGAPSADAARAYDGRSVVGLDAVAWFRDVTKRRTHPVASLAPNAFGLHDMLGNVAEWTTSADGKGRLFGGSYQDRAEDVTARSEKRPTAVWNASDPNLPKSRWWLADAPFAGFRVLCETAPAADAPLPATPSPEQP